MPFASVAPGFFALRAALRLAASAPPRGFGWPTAVGKKNWLFIGEAGERAAILYTLIESCRSHGLDPFAWLRDVLTRLPTMAVSRIPELTPAACAKAARTATRQAA